MYFLPISFQIVGAVLLIIKFWGDTKKRIIDICFPEAGIAGNDGEDKVV